MTKSQIAKWATGFASGLGVMMWVYGSFITKESFKDFTNIQKEKEDVILGTMQKDISEIKSDIRELRVAVIGKKVVLIMPNQTNLWE